MRVAFTLGAIILAVFAPHAAASDILRDESCVPGAALCASPGTCTPVVCTPRSCQPAFHCRSDANLSSECARNTTIEGETCQIIVGGSVRTNDPHNEVAVSLAFSNGTVDAFNLQNTWIAPSAEASATSNDIEVGDISAGLYTSNITTTDGQRHEWRHIGVVFYHGPGFFAGEEVGAGVYLLDTIPEGCYARLSSVVSVSTACPRLIPGDLLGPIRP